MRKTYDVKINALLPISDVERQKIADMVAANDWAAVEWQQRKILGRQDLTKQQRIVLLGMIYNARKEKNAIKKEIRGSVAEYLGNQYGVSRHVFEEAAAYIKGIDALNAISNDAAMKVLAGASKLRKNEIMGFSKLPLERQQEMAMEIIRAAPSTQNRGRPPKVTFVQSDDVAETKIPTPPPKQYRYNGVGGENYKKSRKEIAAIVSDMYDVSTVPEYTINDMAEEIKLNAENYIGIIKNVLSDRSNLLAGDNCQTIAAVLDEVVRKITKIKEKLENEQISKRA